MLSSARALKAADNPHTALVWRSARPGSTYQGVMAMKTIGMIGGMSWESTAVYYRIVNQETNRILGGQHSASVIVYSVDFADIEACQAQARWDDAASVLCKAAQALVSAGAEILVLCTNTMHKVATAIRASTAATFIHIADPTTDAIVQQGLSRIGLLGTRYTMEQAFYQERLAQQGLQVLVPSEEERQDVHTIIYEELCHGTVRDASRARYQEIVRSLARRGAEGIVLGCTEIEMLLGRCDVDLPLFDTTRLHALAAVRAALAA